MKWEEIRHHYPDQWLIVEAFEAETGPEQQRQIKRMGVVEQCSDGSHALARYRELHTEFPQREFYFVHTSQEVLDIKERTWIGIRSSHAVTSQT